MVHFKCLIPLSQALFLRTPWAEPEFSASVQMSNKLIECKDTSNCPFGGCVTLKAVDVEDGSNGDSLDGGEEIEGEEQDQDIVDEED